MAAATVVQQLCKSCRTCFKFYCMFYFTCDRNFTHRAFVPRRVFSLAGWSEECNERASSWSTQLFLRHHASHLRFSVAVSLITPTTPSVHLSSTFLYYALAFIPAIVAIARREKTNDAWRRWTSNSILISPFLGSQILSRCVVKVFFGQIPVAELFTPSPIHRGTGYCFRWISLYLSLFLSLFLC